MYLVEEETGNWWAIFENNDKRLFPLFTQPLEIEYAQGISEHFLRDVESPLITPDAKWRDLPVSTTQRQLLERHNIDSRNILTRGVASDTLDYYFGRIEADKLLTRFNPDHFRSLFKSDLLRKHAFEQLERIKVEMRKKKRKGDIKS